MDYYAKTNTGSPETGFVTIGEVLTAEQVTALGEEKIREMVKRGILAECGEATKVKKPEEPAAAEEAPEPKPEPEAEPENDEELPELGMPEDIVKDEAAEAPKAPKKGGRRKAK